MKWLLISCTLIFFSVGAIRAESEENKNDECYQKFRVQNELEQACRDEKKGNYNDTILEEQFRTNILHYSGDHAAVQALANMYCPILGEVLECLRIGVNSDYDCLDERTKLHQQQEYDVPKALLTYMCADSGAAALKILPHNGIQTIIQNDEFSECMRLAYGVSKSNDEIHGPAIATCDGVDKSYECYTNYVRDHANSDLASIANEVRTVFRQAIKCEA